jgi:hypothetical protein
VAYWNQTENKRSLSGNKVLINDRWPLIFVHFTKDLVKEINAGREDALKGSYQQYQNALQ